MVVAFDTETYLIQPGLLAPPLVCCSFAIDNAPPFDVATLVLRDQGLELLRRDLLNPEATIVGHNVAYDFGVACAADPSLVPLVFAAYDQGRVRDTKIRQQLLDIAAGLTRTNGRILVWRGRDWAPQGLSLADLEQLHLGIDRHEAKDDPKAWRFRYHELDGIPVEQWPADARQYALDDAVGTLRVFRAQGPDVLPDERRQVYKAWALHLASCWGMRTDGPAVDALEAEAKARFGEVQRRLYEAGFYRLEPLTAEERRNGRTVDGHLPGRVYKSKPQDPPKPAKLVKDTELIRVKVRAALESQGLEVPLTPTGEVKTDADTLAQTDDPLLMELGENGPIGTVLRTFVPTLRKGVGVPINTRYNTLLETGRISSSEPNLNNIPRGGGVRECFVPRPGYLLASIDWDCAELRALAQCCLWILKVGFSRMAEFFQRDRPLQGYRTLEGYEPSDPHLMLAATLLGIPFDEAAERKAAGDKAIKHARQSAKALNFGFPGGLGITKFRAMARKNYSVVMTEEEAREGKRKWFETWPEMQLYLDYISAKVQLDNPTVEQLCPEHLRPHRRRGNVSYCDGANGYFQGLVADAAADATCRVSRECYADPESPLWGSRIVAQIYDELLLEVPVALAHEAAFRARDLMIEAANVWMPDVPCTAFPALMTRWTKAAEPKFDAAGRLIPWSA